MSTLTQAHPVFKKGAVLRHSDLNDQIEYLKNLVACSNALLSGIGILRGLGIRCEERQGVNVIIINPGLAVVNLGVQGGGNTIIPLGGQLVELAAAVNLQSKKATTNFTAAEAFTNIEELSTDVAGPAAPAITANDLAKCVFIVVESDTSNNAGASCFRDSEVNEKKTMRLRYFLGTPALKAVVDSNCFAMPCVPCFDGNDLNRIINPDGLNTVLSEKISAGAQAIDTAITALTECYPDLFCEKPNTVASIINAGTTPALYAYNYLQTLYSAYTELISLPYFVNDPYPYKTYPGTLALGNCSGNCTNGQSCRHHWRDATASAAYAPEAAFYAKRLTALTKAENLDFTAPPSTQLTPSRSDIAPLSARAMPFYVRDVLRPQWSYRATFQNTTTAIAPNQSGPCYMEGCNWVRSEGYVGKTTDELQSVFNNDHQFTSSELHTARAQANLPFQIKICSINEGSIYKRTRFEFWGDYLRRNPGLKPCAGVPKGGTLVLLVDAPGKGAPAGAVAPRILADFCLPYYDTYVAEKIPNLFAEFIVEAPNHFTIDDQGVYVFEVPINTELLNIFFKSVSENADILDWEVYEIKAPTAIISAGQGSAFRHNFEVSVDVIYEVKLTASSAVQPNPDIIAKQIRFVFTAPQELNVMAQFVVEAPNNFEETTLGTQEMYTFPIEQLINNETALRVFFKSVSENATEFEWLIPKNTVTDNKESAFNHQFTFTRARSTFEVSLSVKGGINVDQIKKLVRGVYADFGPGQHRLPPGSEIQGPEEVMYKGVLSKKYMIDLSGDNITGPFLHWINQSVLAEIYEWKVWDISKANAPRVIAESQERVEFRFDLSNFQNRSGSYVIELNATNKDSTIVSQRNILVDIIVPQFAARPAGKPDTVTETARALPTSAERLSQLRSRHNKYRETLNALGKTQALFAKTAAFKSALAFLDSGDDPEDLEKTFKNLAQQYIRNIKLEGGTPNEVYQSALQQLLYFYFDKLSFLHQNELPQESAAVLQTLFQQMKTENTFPNLSALKMAWEPDAVRSVENQATVQTLEALFDL